MIRVAIYMDNSATTRVCPEAVKVMTDLMENAYGNPSSLHRMGLESEKAVSAARKEIARSIGKKESTVYFTSGGTESDNTAIIGGAIRNAHGRKTVITSEVEHPAVLKSFKYLESQGFNTKFVRVDSDGVIDLNHLESLISEDVVLVSIMQVNNETGAIMPIKDAYKMVKNFRSDILFHSDMVQSYLKIPFEEVDLASFSAHKVHGPKGVGALYIKEGINVNPIIFGGGQQKNMRPGTENVPGIAGFGEAVKVFDRKESFAKVVEIKKELTEKILQRIDNVTINGGENAIPYVLNMSFKGVKSEVLLHSLESAGIMVSSGSACSSNHPSPSHVLTAMGIKKELIDSSLRFSFSSYNNLEETEVVADALYKQVGILRKVMR